MEHKRWKPSFIRALASGCSVRVACMIVGVSRQTAYNHRSLDAKFAGQWDAALKKATEREAARQEEQPPPAAPVSENGQAKEIADTRAHLGWTQGQLADALGVTGLTVSRWERGEYEVPEPTIRLLRLLVRTRRVAKLKPAKAAAVLAEPVPQ